MSFWLLLQVCSLRLNYSTVSFVDFQEILINIYNELSLTWSNLSEPLYLMQKELGQHRMRMDIFKLVHFTNLSFPIWQLWVVQELAYVWEKMCKEDCGLMSIRLLEIFYQRNKTESNLSVIGFQIIQSSIFSANICARVCVGGLKFRHE